MQVLDFIFALLSWFLGKLHETPNECAAPLAT
jgi:hypothetical protein